MNCSESEQFFDAYLDGELSGSLRLEFDAHRLRCPVCQQKLAMMEACEHILARDSGMPIPSDDFTDRVMNQISARRVIARRSRRRRIVVTAAVALQAAAVLVFAVVWSQLGHTRTEPVVATSTDVEFLDLVDKYMIGKDKVRLTELIVARGDQLAAAQSNLRNDISGLARYASSLSILGDLPPWDDVSPWGALRPIFAPPAPEETEPPPDTTGPFSL